MSAADETAPANGTTAPPDPNAETRTRTSVAEGGGARARLDGTGLPELIGRYRLTGYLGRGGMGVVMAGHDTTLDRPVALKLLHPGMWGGSAAAAARIEREAQAMAKLAHPNVVTVYEVDRAGPHPFIAMELVAGQTLRDWRKVPGRPWRVALRMMLAAGRGLAAAHAVGLVHRDFKPENVLIGADERPRVSDFGLVATTIASDSDGAPGATADGTDGSTLGTPAYMAPEQWAGREVDHRTDQFAFAVSCWEVLWGSRPFPGPSLPELRAQILRGDPPPPASRGGVPRRVEAALRRALRPAKEARWPDLDALLTELERQARDRRPLVGLAAIGLVAAGLAATSIVRGANDTTSPCRTAGAALDRVWSLPRQQALGATFAGQPGVAGAPAWQETARVLDGWAAEHRTLRLETCEVGRGRAAGVAALTAARTACLDRRLTSLDALLATFAAPDPTVVIYARAAAHGLPSSASCRAVAAEDHDTRPGFVAAQPELGPLHAALARAAALRAVGKPRDALAVVEPVARRADELGWPALVAEAQLELGLAHEALQDSDASGLAHRRAAWSADASHDDRVRFAATLGLANAAIQRSSYDEAQQLLETARMIARRLPDDPERQVALTSHAAELAFWRADYGGCIERSRAAIALVDRTLGVNAVIGARMRGNLAQCLMNTGRLDEVEALVRAGLAIADATTGRTHPIAADMLSMLGSLARARNQPEAALGHLRAALAIRQQVFGADSPHVAKIHNNLGNALRDLGRADEARVELERAVTIWEAAWGPDSPAVGTAVGNLGKLAMDRGDLATAEQHFRRTLAIRRAKRPPGHPDISDALVKLGGALLARGDRACLPLLDEAVAAYGAMTDVDPEDLADARFHLGRALVELRVDRARGRALIDAACTAYAASPDLRAEAAACQAYVAALPRR